MAGLSLQIQNMKTYLIYQIHSVLQMILILVLLGSCIDLPKMEVVSIENSIPENSMFPNLYSTGGEVLLSYIHSQGDSLDQLFVTSYDGKKFSNSTKIAEGKDWFVNWADIPAIAKSDNNIIVSWLDKSAEGTYDYDVKMSISNDHGQSWDRPFIPHKDGIAAEHGFVSITVNKEGNFHAIWLDGRNTKLIDENGKASHGQMTLRSAIIHPDGTMTNELEIDERVCDCCQTAIIDSEFGTMAVYRDRTEDEIRDNYFSIFNAGKWSPPKPIHNDNWKIGGCPVNGPVLASHKKSIATAWYTEANEKPEIYLSKYDAAKDSFSEPLLISDVGVIGRLDLEYLDNGNLIAIWLEDAAEHKAIIRAKIYTEALEVLEDISLGETLSARRSGFPKVVRLGSKLVLIYMNEEGALLTKAFG